MTFADQFVPDDAVILGISALVIGVIIALVVGVLIVRATIKNRPLLFPADSIQVKSYRVDYHVWAVGGKLWPATMFVVASSPEAALSEAECQQRNSDRCRGRAYVGFFQWATAIEDPESCTILERPPASM